MIFSKVNLSCKSDPPCKIPLVDESKGESGVYTVNLGFMPGPGDRAGRRVFDISIQGIPVLEKFDIRKEAGGSEKVVIKEFKGIKVDNVLTLELTPLTREMSLERAPLINYIEIVKEE